MPAPLLLVPAAGKIAVAREPRATVSQSDDSRVWQASPSPEAQPQSKDGKSAKECHRHGTWYVTLLRPAALIRDRRAPVSLATGQSWSTIGFMDAVANPDRFQGDRVAEALPVE